VCLLVVGAADADGSGAVARGSQRSTQHGRRRRRKQRRVRYTSQLLIIASIRSNETQTYSV